MGTRVITPIGIAINATATLAGQVLVSTSAALEGAVRFYNVGGTAAFCAMVSAGASAGDAAKGAVIASGDCCLFLALEPRTPIAYVSGASAVFAQAVHYIK